VNNSQLPRSATVAAVFLLMLAAAVARGDTPQSRPMPTQSLSVPLHQKVASFDDAFAGLDLSNEQRAEVQKIRQDAEAHKAATAKNQSLTQDQKDAMIQGYTRIKYSKIFQMLTPAQQSLVRERIRAWQAAEAPNQKSNAPVN
jgi:hypothetical protein